ncbi:MAG: regulatory protein GemA [Desulfobulbaceae bacterium]|nr:regulatory protein GemA [Desulfobulbaceae bacterium]
MPTNADYAKIAIARKVLGIDEQAYRDMLWLHFQVRSAKELSDRQVAVLLNKFRAKGWKPKRPTTVKAGRKGTQRKPDNFKEITPGTRYAQQKKYILAMWNALGYDVAKIDARVKKQFGIDRLEWLEDPHLLHVFVTDLQARCERAGIDYSAE